MASERPGQTAPEGNIWTKDESSTRITRAESNVRACDHCYVSTSKRTVDIRIVPVLFCLGLVVSLNGTSLGQARIRGLQQTLRVGGSGFNVAAMVYYVPCVLFAVPSNLALHLCKSPAIFIAPAVFLCGIAAVGQGVTQSYAGLVVCRILLGLFTTAFDAAAMNVLGAYYLGHKLHKRLTLFLATRLVAGAFGGLLAFGLARMDGLGGYQAWRWIFIIEGLFAVVFGVLSYPFLPGWPENVEMERQGDSISQTSSTSELVAKPTFVRSQDTKSILITVASEPVVYYSALIHFGCTAVSASFTVFLPTLLQSLGWSRDRSNYMTIPVYLTSAVVAIIVGALSDQLRLRYPFCAGPLLVAIVASILPLAIRHMNPWTTYAACILLNAGNFAAQATALTWLGNNIYGRRHRGIALGFVAGLGNLGFLLGSNIYLEAEKPVYTTGHAVSLAVIVLGLVSATAQVLHLHRRQRLTSERGTSSQIVYRSDIDASWLRSERFIPGRPVY